MARRGHRNARALDTSEPTRIACPAAASGNVDIHVILNFKAMLQLIFSLLLGLAFAVSMIVWPEFYRNMVLPLYRAIGIDENHPLLSARWVKAVGLIGVCLWILAATAFIVLFIYFPDQMYAMLDRSPAPG
jgi:hypothetical protein